MGFLIHETDARAPYPNRACGKTPTGKPSRKIVRIRFRCADCVIRYRDCQLFDLTRDASLDKKKKKNFREFPRKLLRLSNSTLASERMRRRLSFPTEFGKSRTGFASCRSHGISRRKLLLFRGFESGRRNLRAGDGRPAVRDSARNFVRERRRLGTHPSRAWRFSCRSTRTFP